MRVRDQVRFDELQEQAARMAEGIRIPGSLLLRYCPERAKVNAEIASLIQDGDLGLDAGLEEERFWRVIEREAGIYA